MQTPPSLADAGVHEDRPIVVSFGVSRRRTTATGVDIVDKLVAQGAAPCIPGLRALAKFVLTRLIDHFNTETGRCDPSVETLARDLASSPRAITREITELRDSGLITVDYRRGTGTTNQYRPNFEAIKRYNPTYGHISCQESTTASTTPTGLSGDPDRPVTASPTQRSGKQSKEQIKQTEHRRRCDRPHTLTEFVPGMLGKAQPGPNQKNIDWQGWTEWLGSQIGREAAILWIYKAIDETQTELGLSPESACGLVDHFLRSMRKKRVPTSLIDREFQKYREVRFKPNLCHSDGVPRPAAFEAEAGG